MASGEVLPLGGGLGVGSNLPVGPGVRVAFPVGVALAVGVALGVAHRDRIYRAIDADVIRVSSFRLAVPYKVTVGKPSLLSKVVLH